MVPLRTQDKEVIKVMLYNIQIFLGIILNLFFYKNSVTEALYFCILINLWFDFIWWLFFRDYCLTFWTVISKNCLYIYFWDAFSWDWWDYYCASSCLIESCFNKFINLRKVLHFFFFLSFFMIQKTGTKWNIIYTISIVFFIDFLIQSYKLFNINC